MRVGKLMSESGTVPMQGARELNICATVAAPDGGFESIFFFALHDEHEVPFCRLGATALHR